MADEQNQHCQTEHTPYCDVISSDAGFSLSQDLNGLKVIEHWLTVFFPGHVMGKETILVLLHLFADMFDLCVHFSVWGVFIWEVKINEEKNDRPVEKYKLFINLAKLEKEF
jgi:hypothetical protein